ncbi:PREDICTED: tyrosine-protein kinase-like otk [Nicrophorus vespilloides]|uniref:Tyrosine-protein kinase-like otk n=1 Tax=Nicrophorus vespilloides TaxID=110193 RepID=A0ABM1M7S6_NICVS|nr:PREDICTED: tyrosine-protein kinase-like otk [Nicrophorus vespilloides]
MFGVVVCAVFMMHLVPAMFGQDEIYFSQTPKDVSVVTGKSVSLPCEVTPNQGVSYYWELNGSRIYNTTRRFQRGSSLHINRVDRERDSGQFTCIAQDQKGLSITSSAASLNIHWIEEASVQLQSPESASYIAKGTEVVLRCHLEASGDVHYEWFRNADRLVKTAKMDIKKKKLHIKSVAPSDNGIYRCTAQNEAGSQHSFKNFALAVAGDDTALIQIVPKNQLVKKGAAARFDCTYQHADVTEWYFKDVGPLESDKRIKVHPNGSLEINEVRDSDKGMYNCVGIRGESKEVPQSYTAELHVAFIHNLTDALFEPPLPEGSKHVIAEDSFFQQTCLEPKSVPPAKKFWMNPDGHTISDSGDVKVDDDGRLILDSVKRDNAGTYTCVAENVAGKTEKSFQLVVTTKPVITENPESVTAEENEASVLKCGFTSESATEFTTVRWRKDGKVIKSDDTSNHQRLKVFKQNGTLVLQSTKISDRGEYLCEILTKGFAPVLSKPATISVIEQLKFVPPPVNKKLELSSVAKLHCKAQGTPPPIVHWEKIGGPLPTHITDVNGTLHFNGVLPEDKGKYMCTATNSQGVINVTVNIDVVVSPKFTVVPKNPTEAHEGSALMIDCVVEGDPKPTVQWEKNLRLNDFDKTRFTIFDNGSLYISEVHKEDENNYACTGGNSAGLNRKEMRLIVHIRDGFHPGDNVDGEGSTVTKAVLITMSVAAAYIILVVGLMVWCRYRRRSRKLPISEAGKTENGETDPTELKEATIAVETNGHVVGATVTGAGPSKPVENGDALKEGQKSDGAETTHSQSSAHSKKSKSNYDKIAFSRSNLRDSKLIGRGEFGDIFAAKVAKSVLLGEKRNSASTPTGGSDEKEVAVLVKSLTQTKDENSLAEFKREIDMFTKLSHENITKLHGLCREEEPHYMILEYTDWGDLKQFLVATQKGSPPALTPVQCVAVIQQVAQALDQISNERFVHRDLAARNCLITSKLLVKVGLPRLTRDPFSQEYCKHANQIIPLRWLPHEAVYEDEYSTKSDVYAFGVLIWEIFNQGELPFPKMNDNSFLAKLKEKSLEWKFHKDTPPDLEKLQERCLDVNPQERPTFAELAKEIETILKSISLVSVVHSGKHEMKRFQIVLFALIGAISTSEGLRCYTCSFQEWETDQKCVTDPANVETSTPITNCNKNYCTSIRVEYVTPKGKVMQMLRGCEDVPILLNEDFEDPVFRHYYRSCQTDLCNGGTGKDGGAGEEHFGGFGVLYVPGVGDNAANIFTPSLLTFISMFLVNYIVN